MNFDKTILAAVSAATLTIAALTFSGCVGVENISDDTYLLRHKGDFLASESATNVEALKEANQFCANIGKKFVQSSTQINDGGLDKHPRVEIQFKCQ